MFRRWAAISAALFLSTLTCAFFACGGPAFTDATDHDGGGSTILPTDAGDASPDASAPDSNAPTDAGVFQVVYVSTSGNDSNSGFSPSAPKKSLVSAIAAAVALDAGAEVHACAGTYPETALDLGGAVSLRGAYDCVSWMRTVTFGYPTFDQVHETIVQNANPALQAQTLVVSGSVPPGSLIDGLTIQGAATLDGTTTGVLIRDEASPLLSDDVITGGAGHPATGYGSIALSIQGAASPQVEHDVFNGGTGTGSVGSTGLVINSTGTPNVHDDVISGGLGTSTGTAGTIASWGIDIQSSAAVPNALANNAVVGCDSAGVVASSNGIHVSGADASVDITGSQIAGCSGTADGGTSIGVQVNAAGATVRILGDRVFGGTRTGASSFVAGVEVVAAGSLTVHNSMLHAGEAVGEGSSATGLSVGPVAGASIVDDTIYAGASSGTGIVLLAGATSTRITDAILLGGGPGQTHAGVFAQSCTGALASLDHDLFANFGGPLYTCNPEDGGPSAATTTIDGLTSLLPTEAFSDLLYGTQSTCGDDAGCIVSAVCPGTPATCLGQLFGSSWTADDGVTGLFSSTAPDGGVLVGGWTLPTGAPCAIAQGGIPVAGITTDIYGVTRSTSTPTIGAAELTGICSP